MQNNRLTFMERLSERLTSVEAILKKLDPIESLLERIALLEKNIYTTKQVFTFQVNPEKPDVPLNKNDAFQKVQKRHVQEKR